MSSERIKVSTTMPSMKDKIHINIVDDTDKIYWYIKFNKGLNKASVSSRTMEVIDTDGYIMRTYIAYDTERQVIVVSPIDTYIENKYYILSISKQVQSEQGENLKKEIYVLFKLINHKISKYELLKSTAKIPQAKPRPDDYDDMMLELHSFGDEEEEKEKDTGKDVLGFQNIKVSIWLVLPGVALLAIGAILGLRILLVLGVTLSIAAIGIIAKQLYNKEKRSIIYYNIGVIQFNKEKYKKAEGKFKKAVELNPDNEQAEYALTKAKLYI